MKEFYEENAALDDPRMVRSLWLGRTGIPIIVNTFNKLYEKAKIKDQIIKKKKMAGWSTDNKRGSLSKVRDPSQVSLELETRKIALITLKTSRS